MLLDAIAKTVDVTHKNVMEDDVGHIEHEYPIARKTAPLKACNEVGKSALDKLCTTHNGNAATEDTFVTVHDHAANGKLVTERTTE